MTRDDLTPLLAAIAFVVCWAAGTWAGGMIGARVAERDAERVTVQVNRGFLNETYWRAWWIAERIRCAGPDTRGCPGPPGSPR